VRGFRRESFAAHHLGEAEDEGHVVVDEQRVRHYDVLAFIDRVRPVQEASHGERARRHVDRSAWARAVVISSGLMRVTSECTNVQFTTIAMAAPRST
jgi:hypothetical protein